MRYTKMHGAGNDFIIINNIEEKLDAAMLPGIAAKLCQRKLSIGADGMMVVCPAEKDGDYKMLFFNADGSMGEMCGNGARCIARYGHDHGLAKDIQRIETTAGLVIGERIDEIKYKVRLNDVSVIKLDINIDIDECFSEFEKYIESISYVELGNPGIPHAVVLMNADYNIEPDKLREFGSYLRYHKAFPKGANVNFTKLIFDEYGAPGTLEYTFERGVEDFTLACGTGAGSIVTVLDAMGFVDGNNTIVKTMGGDLFVTIDKGIFLTGPTCVVSEGLVSGEALL